MMSYEKWHMKVDCSVQLCKYLYKTVTDGISDNLSETFSILTGRNKVTARKYTIIVGLSAKAIARDKNCLFRSLGKMLEDEGQYNRRNRGTINLCCI
jgi:hypothetical protein